MAACPQSVSWLQLRARTTLAHRGAESGPSSTLLQGDGRSPAFPALPQVMLKEGLGILSLVSPRSQGRATPECSHPHPGRPWRSWGSWSHAGGRRVGCRDLVTSRTPGVSADHTPSRGAEPRLRLVPLQDTSPGAGAVRLRSPAGPPRRAQRRLPPARSP